MPKTTASFLPLESTLLSFPKLRLVCVLPLFKFQTFIGYSASPKSGYKAITLDKDHTGCIYIKGRAILFSTTGQE